MEDCDQILIASSIKDSQGWEENGNRGSQGELEEEETVSDTYVMDMKLFSSDQELKKG